MRRSTLLRPAALVLTLLPKAAYADPPTMAKGTGSSAGATEAGDVAEREDTTYLFVGARYRGTVIPKFFINAFIDEGKTIYSNAVAAELDIRKSGFSFIPALQYSEYGTGDFLVKDKGSSAIAGNYSVVNSSMKALYLTADFLWSKRLSNNVEFEYGLGAGVGVLFGDLVTNWVYEDPNGAVASGDGRRFSRCATATTPGTGCHKEDHQDSSVDKVGGYTEPGWFSGGSKPVFFPYLSIPQIGLRVKPVREVVARVGLGFSLTGFWFGLSGQYGLPASAKK